MRAMHLETQASAVHGAFEATVFRQEANQSADGSTPGSRSLALDAQLIEARQYARPAALRILRDRPDDVDDVLQNACLKALRFEGQFRGTAQFKVWFMRIAINEALYLLRARRNSSGRFVDIDEEYENGERKWELPDKGPSPEELAIGGELRGVIFSAARKMTARRQAELGFCLLGEGVGTGSMRKARRHRLREGLRKALMERGMLESKV
jgi:RNA polymerase sigma factor (sigma-70 family)